MDKFLKEVLGNHHDSFATTNIKKGIFDVRVANQFSIESNGLTREVNRSDKIGLTAVDFEKQVNIIGNHTDFSGVNKEFIGASDQLNVVGAVNAMVVNNLIQKQAVVKFSRTLDTYISADSHTAFLLNMLVSWLKATLRDINVAAGVHQHSQGLTLTRRNYKDSHITVTKYEGEAENVDINIPLHEPNNIQLSAMTTYTYNVSGDEAVSTRKHVVCLPKCSDQALRYYAKHLLGRDRESALNFEFLIPGVALNDIAVYDTAGTGKFVPPELDEEMNIYANSFLQWELIMKYTSLNRVERHLGAAFQILCDCTFRATCDVAEGFAYRLVPTQIFIPAPAYSRARMPSLLMGSPYIKPESTNIIDMYNADTPIKYLMAYGVLNYYADAGLYLAATHTTKMFPHHRAGLGSMMNMVPELGNVSTQLAAARSYSLGMAAPHMNYSTTGVMYNMTQYFEYDLPVNYVFCDKQMSKEDSAYEFDGEVFVTGKREMQPVSLIGMYGRARDDINHIRHFGPQIKHTFTQEGDYLSLDEALIVATIYRIAEHDISMLRFDSEAPFTAWAALSSPALSAKQMHPRWHKRDMYEVVGVHRRRSWRISMPETAISLKGQSIKMTVTNTRMFISPADRKVPTKYDTYDGVLPVTLPRMTVKVPAGGAYIDVKSIPALRSDKLEPVDFGEVERISTENPPSQPAARPENQTVTLGEALDSGAH